MSPAPLSRVWLVIPAWCETGRLDAFTALLFPTLAAEACWLGFCDADGSVDAVELVRLCREALAAPAPVCLCASRHVGGADARWGSPLRQVLSHLFDT